MIVQLDTLELNDFTSIRELPGSGVSENITLAGSMYIDYMYQRRGWELTWDILPLALYEQIREKFDRQYETGQLAILHIPAKNAYGQCHLKIPNQLDLKFDNQYYYGFTLTIQELGAIS